ncbi:MAG: glycosyltransferase family 2 protein [Flammeovirgaceae bacterium]|nr:glycosyltransferase family 2 protein [Flammeovirgaceae bacterium]
MSHKSISIIIPAFNEEASIGKVIQDIPREIVSEIVVVNNGSTDHTSERARDAGAIVIDEPNRGYGNACLTGIDHLKTNPPDIVVFMDADYSDYPEEISMLIAPIIEKDIDLVIGSRTLGAREKGSLTPQQIFGNWLATTLLRWIYGAKFSDLGPFRAIKFQKLLELEMKDKTYGWTVEMQLKAAKKKYSFTEIPVRYRKRIGKSKISGTISGTFKAGYKILYTIFKYW